MTRTVTGGPSSPILPFPVDKTSDLGKLGDMLVRTASSAEAAAEALAAGLPAVVVFSVAGSVYALCTGGIRNGVEGLKAGAQTGVKVGLQVHNNAELRNLGLTQDIADRMQRELAGAAFANQAGTGAPPPVVELDRPPSPSYRREQHLVEPQPATTRAGEILQFINHTLATLEAGAEGMVAGTGSLVLCTIGGLVYGLTKLEPEAGVKAGRKTGVDLGRQVFEDAYHRNINAGATFRSLLPTSNVSTGSTSPTAAYHGLKKPEDEG